MHFGMWLWVAVSAYAFGLALWRSCGLPDVLPGILRLIFSAVWLVLLVALGRFWMRRAIRRTVVQGG